MLIDGLHQTVMDLCAGLLHFEKTFGANGMKIFFGDAFHAPMIHGKAGGAETDVRPLADVIENASHARMRAEESHRPKPMTRAL